MWVAVPVTRPTVLASRIAHPCRNEQRRSPHLYVNVSMYLPLKKANTWHALYIPMSIYNCFVFDKGSEFARLQTVKEQSALVDTFSYMYPHLSASAFLHEYWYEDGAKIHIYMQISKLYQKKIKTIVTFISSYTNRIQREAFTHGEWSHKLIDHLMRWHLLRNKCRVLGDKMGLSERRRGRLRSMVRSATIDDQVGYDWRSAYGKQAACYD